MGMSIDESIIALERDIHNAKLCGYQIDQYKVAIDTMRKYQKIEQIIKDIPYGGEATARRILEMVEDVDALPNDERSKTCTKCVSFSNTCRICHNKDMYKEQEDAKDAD